MSDTQHRVLKWGGIILGLAGIVGMPTGFFLYLEDLRVIQRDRDAMNKAAIVKVLNAIEISAESKRVLDEGWLELDQSGQVRLENQINELESGHKILIQEINDMHADVIHSLGRHEGRHETCR